jgi:hypothetical protein
MTAKNSRFSYFFIVVMIVMALGLVLLDGDEPADSPVDRKGPDASAPAPQPDS